MAAGRGEFFQCFWEAYVRGSEGKPGQTGPGRRPPGAGRAKPTPGGGQPGPGGVKRSGRRRNIAPRFRERTVKENKTIPQSKENYLERLPPEVLFKILSYLDASSLSCIGHVSKLFQRLANDNVLWHHMYLLEFGSQVWRPKPLAEADAAPKVDPVEAEAADWSEGHWKKMYFRADTRQEMNQWGREMKVLSPFTGLPRQTDWVLRYLNVGWELSLSTVWGQEIRVEQSKAYFFESSVIVRWSGESFPSYSHLRSIRLYGVRRSPKSRRPGWRSLILKLDVKTQFCQFIGTDKLVKLRHLQPGVIIGTWRGTNCVAFIMASLHFYKLVEKSLLGSPVIPYAEAADPPPADASDPELGLHGYTLHFVLHGTGSEIMSGHFCRLSCCTALVKRGLVELSVIDVSSLSQHRSLSGNVKLPWKSGDLEGSVENCCILSLTLLDVFQKPFWCVSAPICIRRAERQLSSDYSGEHFLMDFQNSEGRVKMKLVWLKEQKQFFVISLALYVAVYKVNEHFRTAY